MKYIFGVLCIFLCLPCGLMGQSLKRAVAGTKTSMLDTPYSTGSDIFTDYRWSRPQIAGKEIDLSNGKAEVPWQGSALTFSREAADRLTLTAANGKVISANAVNDDTRYLDHRSVILVPRTVYRYVPSYRSVAYQAPYQASRSVPVTSYRYNPSTKSTQTVYSTRTEFYTAYRTQFRYETSWNWQSATELQLKVLPSKHYSFSLGEGQNLTIYEKEGKYYLQNPSYLVAQNAEGVNCLLVDFNANGAYFDPQDRVMWTAWNPYDKGSKYKAVKGFRGNTWYSVLDLEESHLVTLSGTDGRLRTESLNQRFANVKDKGTVSFQGVPANAVLKINGNQMKLNSKGKPFTAEYGEYHYVVSVPDHLDAVGKFVVDAEHPAPQIQYASTGPAVMARFTNPPQPDYFVTITNSSGEVRTYQSPKEVPIGLGPQELAIEVNGVVLTREVDLAADAPYALDIASAFNEAATSLEEDAQTAPTDSVPTQPQEVPVKAAPKKRGK